MTTVMEVQLCFVTLYGSLACVPRVCLCHGGQEGVLYHMCVCAMETRRGCCTTCVPVPWRPGGGAAPGIAVTDHCEPPCG